MAQQITSSESLIERAELSQNYKLWFKFLKFSVFKSEFEPFFHKLLDQAYKFSKRISLKRQSEASRFALCLNYFSPFALFRFRIFDKAILKSERFSL